MKTLIALLSTMALLSACQQPEPQAEPPQVESAWINAPLPGAPVTAAYFTLRNPGTSKIALVGVSSPACERMELHETRLENGVARMREVKRLEIASASSLVLEPGGLHGMCFSPVAELGSESSVQVVLTLNDSEGQSLTLEQAFEVRTQGSATASPEGHEGHAGHPASEGHEGHHGHAGEAPHDHGPEHQQEPAVESEPVPET